MSSLSCWTCVLSGVILAFNPQASCIIAPQACDLYLPCDDKIWRARSARDWTAQGGDKQMRKGATLWKTVKALLLNQPVLDKISSFGLVSLIGCMLAYICGHERLALEILDDFEGAFVKRMERSLGAWESLWRRHPDAELVPTRRGDPLLADCFPLLGSAYYHLYVGMELRTLKCVANDTGSTLPLPTVCANSSVLKAVRYAANSWLIRVKIGVEHLKRAAPLEYGGHITVSAFEGGKSISHFANACLRRRGESRDSFRHLFLSLAIQLFALSPWR